jgi:hypothetical protein
MRYSIYFLLFILFALLACEEDELDFQRSYDNESIIGTWNLNSIWWKECGSFSVEIANTDTTNFFTEVISDKDTFEIDPVTGDTVPLTIPNGDTTIIVETKEAVNGLIVDSLPELDPITGQVLGYNLRYELKTDPEASFEVEFSFDTVFTQDEVIAYEECSSSLVFNEGGGGSYSLSTLNAFGGSGDLSWSDLGNGMLEICFSGQDCNQYEALISGSGAMSLVDNNFNNNDCAIAEWTLNRGSDIQGTYQWTAVSFSDCALESEDYSGLVCNVEPDNPVVEKVGAFCNELVIDCDNTGVLRVTGGPNEGEQSIAISQISDTQYLMTFAQSAGTDFSQADLTINGNSASLTFNFPVTTLDGFVCTYTINFEK